LIRLRRYAGGFEVVVDFGPEGSSTRAKVIADASGPVEVMEDGGLYPRRLSSLDWTVVAAAAAWVRDCAKPDAPVGASKGGK
jgi:hypothetical protein